MGHLLDENVSHEFNDLIRIYGGVLAAFGPVKVYGDVPAHQLIPLNSACLPWLLYVRCEQAGRIAAEQLDSVYRQIELPLVAPIVAISQTGIRVDVERLACIRESHETQCEIIRHQLEQIAGRPVDIGSPYDVIRLLFEQLRLPVTASSPGGAPSTDQEALEPLRGYHPAVDLVMRGRRFQTVASAAKSLLVHADMGTGRVYPCLDPVGAVTGRLSCSYPNLQALPAALLEAIVADEEHVLAEIDYAQMEVRVLANLAQDQAMCDAFVRGEDIHNSTATKIFGVTPDCATPEHRQICKGVNFGIVYGQTAIGLASKLSVSVEQAAEWIGAFYRSYPSIEQFVTNTKNFAQTRGYVVTYFGRRRRLPLVDGTGGDAERQHALRQAVNAVVQGTAADLNKLALSRVFHSLPSSARLLLNIHDAVLLLLRRDDASTVLGPLQALMEELPAGWNVHLRTAISTGRSWRECKGH